LLTFRIYLRLLVKRPLVVPFILLVVTSMRKVTVVTSSTGALSTALSSIARLAFGEELVHSTLLLFGWIVAAVFGALV
jgi:uncharacterized membrane protein YfcA